LASRADTDWQRAPGDERLSQVVGSYVDAWERGDIDAVVAMLTQDARITMRSIPTWYRDATRSRRSSPSAC
jgi:RNA polymerase sigma-70 factor (ECF subfamily)